MAAGQKRTTILDIARIAHASTATVSRVLNRSTYPVSSELRDKILQVAEQLDYRPNIFSQVLKGGTNKVIGVIVPSITNPFYSQLVAEVEEHCLAAGYAPIICSSHNRPELESKHIDMLLQQQAAGIVISTVCSSNIPSNGLGGGTIPCVLFDQAAAEYEGDSVTFDFLKAGRMACSHLIELGHKHIAFASAPLDRPSRNLLFTGYKESLKEAGLRFDKKLAIIAESTGRSDGEMQDYHCGRVLAETILAMPSLPSAVQVMNDITAIGMMSAFQERNVRVPHDISVVGFDDITFASMITPPLTTIRQSTATTAELAAQILLKKIDNPTLSATRIVIEPELVQRASACRRDS